MIYDKMKLLITKGELLMSQSNQSKEYNRLFEKYNQMSDEELSEIVNPKNGYTELAIKVASDILHSDRKKYYENINYEQPTVENTEKIKKGKINKDEILINMSRDIHSIKNMLLFFFILTIIGGIISVFSLVYAIESLFP